MIVATIPETDENVSGILLWLWDPLPFVNNEQRIYCYDLNKQCITKAAGFVRMILG